MTRRWWLLCLLSLFACDGNDSGAGEAFRLRNAQFIPGALPGTAQSAGAAAPAADGGMHAGPPSITFIETANVDVFAGQGGKALRGRTTNNAASVAIALSGADAGYWVVPIGALDPATDELTWNAVADFDFSLTPGKHKLKVVAVDDAGHAGAQLTLDLCVSGTVPDNRSRCYPDKDAPRAVISLNWDVNADLDLQVVDSSERVVDAKHPNTPSDAGEPLGMLDRDSNAGCVIDGMRSENLIWNEAAPEGRYRVYVNLFDACGQPAVRFRVALYVADPSTNTLVPRLQKSGELLDLTAEPSADRGLFVTELVFD